MARSGSIFEEAMYKCSCSVGETFNKCSRPLHIQALDYRAATFEAMKELERARRDAEWMLELAPQLPDVRLHACPWPPIFGKAEISAGLSPSWKSRSSAEESGTCMEDILLRPGSLSRQQRGQPGENHGRCSVRLIFRNTTTVANTSLVSIKQLFAAWKSLQLRFGRKDPLLLPREIFYLIFSRLDFSSLVCVFLAPFVRLVSTGFRWLS